MRLELIVLLVLMMSSFGGRVGGQDEATASAKPDAAAEAKKMEADLEALRKGLYTAFNEGRYEEMLKEYCHADVVATWQDGNVSHGHDEVLQEFKKLTQFIDKIHLDPTVEKRAVFNGGNTVISTGKLNDTYKLKRGETVSLGSNWTGTMVRENGKWLLTSFNGSANSFDNNVMRLYVNEAMNRLMFLSAAIGGLVGVAVGFFFARRLAK